jgi:hypothetical protein
VATDLLTDSEAKQTSALREVAPVLVLGAGLVGAVLWSGIIGGRASAAPPYLLSQGLLMLIGFTLATRGAPRWSYPWLAFGVVATSALLSSLIASDADPTPGIVIVAVATGPVLAVLLATVISVRSWGDAYAFLALFLAGIVVSWLTVGPPGSLGAAAEGTLVEMAALLLALIILSVVLGMAVLAWNRGVTEVALVLLGSVLLVTAISFDVMIPEVEGADFAPPNFVSFLSLYLFLAMATFAAGSIRRVFAGKGMIGPAPLITAPEKKADEADEDEDDGPAEDEVSATDDGGDGDAPRPKRRRQRGSGSEPSRRRRRR